MSLTPVGPFQLWYDLSHPQFHMIHVGLRSPAPQSQDINLGCYLSEVRMKGVNCGHRCQVRGKEEDPCPHTTQVHSRMHARNHASARTHVHTLISKHAHIGMHTLTHMQHASTHTQTELGSTVHMHARRRRRSPRKNTGPHTPKSTQAHLLHVHAHKHTSAPRHAHTLISAHSKRHAHTS